MRNLHIAALIALFPAVAQGATSGGWTDDFTTSWLNGDVHAVVEHEGALIASGEFHFAAKTRLNGIARLDPIAREWQPLGTGFQGTVRALASSGDFLAAAGDFAVDSTARNSVNVRNIARWNGTEWVRIGDLFDRPVHALTFFQGNLVALGEFTYAGATPLKYVARWNGTSWESIGAGLPLTNLGGWTFEIQYDRDLTMSLAATDDALYAAVDRRVFKWDGLAWTAIATFDETVKTLAIHDGELVAAGRFSNYVMRWNGTSWTAFSAALPMEVQSAVSAGGVLYVGGAGCQCLPCTYCISSYGPRVYRWDGMAWQQMGPQVDGTVMALAPYGGKLVAAGRFRSLSDGRRFHRVIQWDGSDWAEAQLRAPGETGLDGPVHEFATYGGKLIAAGDFMKAGQLELNHIGAWDGHGWTPLGTGLNGTVHSLFVWNDILYAGGSFSTASGVSASNIAAWDGTGWSALGAGVGGSVRAIAAYGGSLYAGGTFTTAGGAPTGKLASWDGEVWRPVTDGVDGCVYALCSYNGKLIVGGSFNHAGSLSAQSVAAWNGTGWSSFGRFLKGMTPWGPVLGDGYHFLSFNDRLLAGGYFNDVYGGNDSGITEWQGGSWGGWEGFWAPQPCFDVPTPDVVFGLAFVDSKIVAGGYFLRARPGDVIVNNIARWNGTTWDALSTGANDVVRAIGDYNGIIAGGDFSQLGDANAPYIGRWSDGWVAVKFLKLSAERSGDQVTVSWEIADSDERPVFNVYRSAPGGERALLSPAPLSGRTSYEFVDLLAPAGEVEYWIAEISRDGQVDWHGPIRPLEAGPPVLRAQLEPGRPNPFHASTRIAFTLPAAGLARIDIIDISGRRWARVLEKSFAAGRNEITWDGLGTGGQPVPAGIYLCRLSTAQGIVLTQKLVRNQAP